MRTKKGLAGLALVLDGPAAVALYPFMILVRLLCIAAILLTAAGTIAWLISKPLSCALFLAMIACFASACLVKTKSP